MQKLIIGIAPNVSIEIQADGPREIVEQANFWSQLPHVCPKCENPVTFFYKTPRDNAYWGLICSGSPAHETNFGVYKDLSRGFYYKGDESWQPAYAHQQEEGREEPSQSQNRPQAVQAPQNDRFDTPTVEDLKQGIGGKVMAENVGDMVSGKQMGMIKALARDAGADADGECRALFSCNVDELSKKGASAFITHLQELKAGDKTPAPTQALPPQKLTYAPASDLDDIPF